MRDISNSDDLNRLIINLPFEGFYNSRYSAEVDHVEQMDAENLEERDREEQPPELRLEASDFAHVLFDCTDYHACYLDVSKAYVDAFNIIASDHLDMPLGLQWESMDSPREYNFATDRVYAYVTLEVMQALFAKSEAEGHKRLAAAIKERFTSYDGFISGYRNDLAVWLEKPLEDWDHNELCTLLGALLSDAEDFGWSVYYRVVDDDGVYNEWSNAVDWPKFEAKVQELREGKLAELREDDPDFVPSPVRCDRTIDMFTGRAG